MRLLVGLINYNFSSLLMFWLLLFVFMVSKFSVVSVFWKITLGCWHALLCSRGELLVVLSEKCLPGAVSPLALLPDALIAAVGWPSSWY